LRHFDILQAVCRIILCSALLHYPMFSVSKNITSGLRSTIMSAIDFTYVEMRALCVDFFASASVIKAGLPATSKEYASAAARGSLTLSGADQRLAARYVGSSSRLSREVESTRCDYIASLHTTKSEPNQTPLPTPVFHPFLRLSPIPGAAEL
jgi:hypothetical protein